jgi:hypothetical protein
VPRDELVAALRSSDVGDPDPQVIDVAAVRAHVVVVNGLGAVPVRILGSCAFVERCVRNADFSLTVS